MIVEIRIWADNADCRPREVVLDDEIINGAVGTRLWTVGELVDLALATAPADATVPNRDRRPALRVIEGGKGG
jgi:hypothetical protein